MEIPLEMKSHKKQQSKVKLKEKYKNYGAGDTDGAAGGAIQCN